MLYPVLLLITASALWAVIHRLHQHRFRDAAALMFIYVAACINIAITNYLYSYDGVNLGAYFIQALFSCMIVPAIYIYFSRQAGRKMLTRSTIAMLCLIMVLFIPNIIIDLSYSGTGALLCEGIHSHSLNIISNGRLRLSIPLESIIIISQLFICTRRILILAAQMKHYELKFSGTTKLFFIWTACTIGFIILYQCIPIHIWAMEPHRTCYFVFYTLLCCSGFTGAALNIDLHPIVTKEGNEKVQLDRFIQSNRDLASKVRELLGREDVYTRQGLVIDDVVGMLGTNRTYFTRMMRAEFGMSFTEYMHQVRVELCKKKLLESDASLEDIALETGFGSASNLSRVFKKETGECPDAWRIAHSTSRTQL